MDDHTAIPPLPQLDEELIQSLDKRFPSRCPSLATPDREIWFYAGQRHLVEFLKSQFQLQQENRFKNHV
jgi:hypothetical protein